MLNVAAGEQAGSRQGTDFVSELDTLTDLSGQGILTAEEFQTKRFALVSRVFEQAPHADFISQLSTLADLSTQGFLTDEEFQTKKKELVRRMLNQSSDAGVLASD